MGLAPGDKTITALALALGTFMQVLDSTIANVSIPTIAGNLGVSPDQGTWVITSFAVANGVSVPLTGWLMQRYGVVRTFVLSVSMFTIASVLCGMAWSIQSLIAFRVLQGAVSGPMIPGSQALLLAIFPPEKRGTALAIWSMTTLVAPICGPILGGYISDNWSWPWIFFINLPVGIFSAYFCWRYLGKRETPTRQLPVDTIGLGLLVLWIGALQIMLDRGKQLDWFASTQITVLAIVASVGFIAFIIWELTEDHPIVDLSLFKDRNFTLGTIALCFGYATFFGNVVLLPLWLQTQIGYTATWAGLVAAPSGVVAVLISPFVGKYLQRSDARWFAAFAFVTLALSFYMRSLLTVDADFSAFVAPMLVQGLAMGTFFIALVAISLHGLEPSRIPAASGMSNFLRITAGSFATSITISFWDRHAAFHQARLSEASSVYDPALKQAMTQLHHLGFSHDQSLALLMRELVSQAYLLSTLDYFWITSWICVALIGLVWLCKSTVGSNVTAAAE
ncbi:MAG: DHA2 family efflux MFS transporter permease subunit [Stenotrophobium sp.]